MRLCVKICHTKCPLSRIYTQLVINRTLFCTIPKTRCNLLTAECKPIDYNGSENTLADAHMHIHTDSNIHTHFGERHHRMHDKSAQSELTYWHRFVQHERQIPADVQIGSQHHHNIWAVLKVRRIKKNCHWIGR